MAAGGAKEEISPKLKFMVSHRVKTSPPSRVSGQVDDPSRSSHRRGGCKIYSNEIRLLDKSIQNAGSDMTACVTETRVSTEAIENLWPVSLGSLRNRNRGFLFPCSRSGQFQQFLRVPSLTPVDVLHESLRIGTGILPNSETRIISALEIERLTG